MNNAYLAGIIAMLVSLIILGAVAIDQAYELHKERKIFYPPTRPPTLIISMDNDKLSLYNGFPFLKVERGKDVTLTLTIQSYTDRPLHPELLITYGAGNEEQVLPKGVHAEFIPKSVELFPRDQSKTNLTLYIDRDAPDGTYSITITAYDRQNNEGVGNGFTLVVGEGSIFYTGPKGTIGPAPTFVQQCSTDDLPTGSRTGPYIRLEMTDYELSMKSSESTSVTIYLIGANSEEARNLVNHLSGCKLRILQPGEIHYPYDGKTIPDKMPLGTGAGLEKYILTIKPSNETLAALSNQLILDSTKLTVYSTNSAKLGTYLIGIPVEGHQGVLYRALLVIRLTIT